MKRSILTFGVLIIALLTFNSNTIAQEAKVGGAEISFDKETHDYGVMKQHGNGECVFVFTNTGTEPLIISNAKGSCGCTVPDWPKEPIMPGKKGVIDVIYKPNKSQAGSPQQKTVTVTANTNPANTILNIKAVVNPEK